MTRKRKQRSELRAFPPALQMLGGVLILFFVVGVFTARNIQQTGQSVSRLLAERGNALIEVLESSLRSDIRSRGGTRVQNLLEDLSSREDILFIALVLSDGTIVGHSDPSRVGKQLQIDGKPATSDDMRKLRDAETSEDESAWSIMRMEGQRAFVAHRALFTHDEEEDARLMPPHMRHMSPMGQNHMAPGPRFPFPLGQNLTSGVPVIQAFVGQDTRPLLRMQEQNMRSALFAGALVLLASLMGFVALRYFEHGVESRRRMRVAETLAQNMVDEVKRLEKEMRRQEKMAAVGDLAAGVAHELRNPLSSIKGYATYFGTRFPEGSEDRESAKIMVQEVDRLNRVITDLIGVSRPTDIHPVITDMARLADDTLRLIAQDANQRGVSVRREGPASEDSVVEAFIDPDRFRQALLNICLNAVEAMDGGGELVVRVGETDDAVTLDVEDNGPGIPAEILNRVFDPYFTTKSQGTGLGLVMVLKIVDAHRGTVHITSEPGQGTVAHISLPRQTPAKAA